MIYNTLFGLIATSCLTAESETKLATPLPTIFPQEFYSAQVQESPIRAQEAPIAASLLSPHKELEITDNRSFTKSEMKETCYHEMLVHAPLLAHEHPKSVLILGDPNGGTVKEVLKHPSVLQVSVVQASPSSSVDARVHHINDIPARFIKKCNETFDIILCDTEETNFTAEFYRDCKELLNKQGIFVNYCGIPDIQQETLKPIRENRALHFKHTTFYLAAIPNYGQVALGWASDKKYRVSEYLLEDRLSKIKGPMVYYTPEVHRAAFALPNFIAKQ